jgi:hypothetical protein
MKNSNHTIGYRTRDLPACRAVPQPTAPLHAQNLEVAPRFWKICEFCNTVISLPPTARLPLAGQGFTVTLRHTTLGMTPLDE